MDADRIIVLDSGKISAIGTHRQLLEHSPYYRAMSEAQLGKGAAEDGEDG